MEVVGGLEGVTGVGAGVTGAGVTGAVGAGMLDLQIEGWPEQVHPLWILHPEHPGEGMLPVSQVSVPMMSPSPH